MKKLFILVVGLFIALGAGVAHASLVYEFSPANTFSGTAPKGTLTATFSDVDGGVQLVITSNLVGTENLDPGKALYLNLNPALDATKLSFTKQSDIGGFTQAATVLTGTNTFKADGDGLYDIMFTYSSATKAFTSGESQTYLITGIINLKAVDFSYLSEPDGGNGPWFAAVHVQNTPNGGSGSGWVAAQDSTTVHPVPIPPTAYLLGAGLIGFVGLRRKFFRK